jgi:branched-chain amino acid transport system substrate-binding protein
MTAPLRRRRGLLALAATCLVFTAACGTRVGDAEIVAGAGGGPVTLPQSVLDQLKSAAPAAPAGVAAAPGTAPAGATPAGTVDPGATAAAPQPGIAAPGSTTGVVSPGTVGTAPKSATGAKTTTPTTATKAGRTAGQGAKASTAPGAVNASAAAPCTAKGAPVSLGQVGNFTGIAGPITASARTAMAVWAKDVNARGGVACHPVVLYQQDDGSESSKSAAVVQDLVQNKKVAALVGNFVVLSMSGFRSGIEAQKIPSVGGDVLSEDWNDSAYMFPQGAGINSVTFGLIKQSVGEGKTKLGLLYCVEASACTTAAKSITNQSKQAGADLVYSSAISLTQTDFTAQCQNAKNAGVQALGLAMDGSAMGRVARSCAAIGYHPQFGASGLTISPAQAEDPILRGNTMATASVNAPWMLNDTPGLQEYNRAMKTYAPNLAPDAVSIAAWSSGKLFEAAIAALGPSARSAPITTEVVLSGLGKIKKETLGGLAPPITFSPGQKKAPPITCVFYELLTTKGWTAPRGSKAVCN